MARFSTVIFTALLLSAAMRVGFAQQQVPGPPGGQAARVPLELVQRAQTEGTVRVIVRLNVATQPEGLLTAQAAGTQRAAIAAVRTRELGALAGTGYQLRRQYDSLPYVAVDAAPAALAALAQSPDVIDVVEDFVVRPTLAESVPLVEGPQAWAAGFDGTGWAVAVIDTGVDKGHSFMTGKVVSEACYSATPTCPNGTDTQIGNGAGVPCTFAPNDCDHGTHVAGIAAGSGTTFSGVARGAGVIAIQVFSAATCNGSPCALAFSSDIIAGLDRVYQLRSTFQIAAVNLSLGGDFYSSQGQCDAVNPAVKSAIDLIRSVNIAPVISSGNGSQTNAIGWPGCISSAVSVGSTTKLDAISGFSNSAPFLSLLAPGQSINSSVPGGGFDIFNGTSMAAPHVAGTWAVIRQRAPWADVTTVLAALQTTGVPITDTRNGVVTPRIRVFQALQAFSSITMTINDVRVSEGHAGTKNATFTVSLSGTNSIPVTAHYATSNGTATGWSSFANTSVITIADAVAAIPYPSSITIPGGLGTITRLRVVLAGFSHTFPSDVDVLLTGPGGQTCMLMSDVGGGSGVTNLTFTIDDAGATFGTGMLTSGTFAPTNLGGSETMPVPAPPGLHGSSTLSGFTGTDPTGTWQLFIRDDAAGNGGSLASGWALEMSTTTSDFVGAMGPVTIAPGLLSQTLSVQVNGDTALESSETFSVTLSDAFGATVSDGVGVGTIVNDDFTDPSLLGATVKAVHINELRAAVNEARAAKGLSPFGFTDPVLNVASTWVRQVHVIELRTALAEAYVAASQTPPAYTDPVIVPGITAIRAVHLSEIRAAAANLP